MQPDYLAVHGYKWLLCPRGAAWLVTRDDRVGELRPLAPNWRSAGPPYGYFGLPMRLAGDAARCDASPAWFSWVGACAALRLLGSLDAGRVERHCLGLAARLSRRGIRVTSLGDRIRFGFHYFNNDHDVDRTVEALSQVVPP